MKIAFVGKGGSGKSTISALYARFLQDQGYSVFAIDADYNMDMAYLLGYNEQTSPIPLMNHSESDFYTYQDIAEGARFKNALSRGLKPFFSSPAPDWFTNRYSRILLPHLRLAVAGGYHEENLYGNRCSHAYFAPLKYYIAAYHTAPEEHMIIDSVAGTDMVAYGLYRGVDAVVCVTEQTPQSTRVAQQISNICTEFDIPFYTIHNKVLPDMELADIISFPLDMGLLHPRNSPIPPSTLQACESLFQTLNKQTFDQKLHINRHLKWLEKNQEAE